ncbi:MAG: hypothetical protein PHU68_01285 [Paludibacter sp.]|nr:hypothetical protein [Paludibacter sp.]
MKASINLIWIVLLVVVITSMGYLINDNVKQRKENVRLSLNLDQYGRQVSSLELTKKELKTELEKKEKTIVAVDSILKARNMRITQLERVIATRITITDSDTTFIPLEKSVPVYLPTPVEVGQLYKTVFKTAGNCMAIEGFILSTDPDPSLALTKKTLGVTVYNIEVKRKWYQFWKPKYEKVVTSDCGDVEIVEIERK